MPQPVHYSSFQSALLQRGVLTQDQLQAVLEEAGKLPLERYLAQSKLVTAEALTLTVAAYFNLPPITLPATLIPPPELIDLIPSQIWTRAKAVPLLKLGQRLTVVFGDPFDLMAQEEVARNTRLEIIPLVAAEREVSEALSRAKARTDAANPKLAMENIMKGLDADIEFSSEPQNKEESIDQTLETAEEAPVIRMVNMMIDKFPEGRQNQIRSMLADTLKGVIAQTLCKKIEGGRIAAFEVLVVTTAISALIREAKTHMIPSLMQTGKNDGMQTFSDELTRQAVKGIISAEDAYIKAIDKVDIETKFRLAGLNLDFKKEAEQALRKTQMERARAILQTAQGTLAADPKNTEALCAAAWIMGASPHDELRNGREAVKLAERACDLQRDRDPHALAVLGVAQAEYGSFRRAIDATNRAIALYTQSHESAKALALHNRLNMFKQNKPYRDE